MSTFAQEYEHFAFRLYMSTGVGGGGGSSAVGGKTPIAPVSSSAAVPSDTPAALSPEVARKVALMLQVGEECQTVPELEQVLTKKANPICYDGFEPSGRMHIAQGVFKAVNVNRCAAAGCTFVFWVADWFALMNDKMGGELEKIQTVGKYFIEVWRASGMDMSHVRFQWASEDINKNANEYWMRVLDIGRKSSISRITKCCQIMGRKEGTLTSAQILYPLMQCTDIFFLKADVCQLGLDQRKVNMLARDYCDQIGRKLKPIILSHHMLQGLTEDRDEEGNLKKMSKSNPDSAVFMEDTEADIVRKITQSYCPKTVKENPCLDYVRNIVFGKESAFLGYNSYESVEAAFLSGALPEKDLKAALAKAVNSYVEPVRKHFETDSAAKALLEKVRQYKKEAPASAAAAPKDAAPKLPPHTVAWLYPTAHYSLADTLHIVGSLNDAVRAGSSATLVLADWTSYATNHIVGEEKDIAAVLDYAVLCVQGFGLDPKVKVVKQSTVILQDSDMYWVRVIEVGRRFMLSSVETAWGQALECAGQVIAVLMHVADVYVLKATEVIGGYSGVTKGMNDLAAEYQPFLISKNVPRSVVPILSDPTATVPDTSAEQILFCDDADADTKKKIKRAFGPPGQVAGNPLIPLAALCIQGAPLKISRAPEHGGDKTYTTVEEVSTDYASGSLHPGDLKAAVTPLVLALSAKCREAVASAQGKKLVTALKVVEKKQQKK